jgi:hypothetical protein
VQGNKPCLASRRRGGRQKAAQAGGAIVAAGSTEQVGTVGWLKEAPYAAPSRTSVRPDPAGLRGDVVAIQPISREPRPRFQAVRPDATGRANVREEPDLHKATPESLRYLVRRAAIGPNA